MSDRERKRGILVPAAVVARETGLDIRTVRKMLSEGILRGPTSHVDEHGRRRWYVFRASWEAYKAGAT